MSTITKINSYQSDVTQLRVAAYCRVSTDNIDQLESLENQRVHYREYISNHPNWQLAKIYYDEGISGTKLTKRDALKELLADCHNHRIDLMVTKSISRLSRNTTDCLRIVRELQQLNIPIIFEKERINTGAMTSELFLSILSSIAQDESHSTAGNLRWAIRQRFASGEFRVSSAPYGYSIEDGNLIINSAEARIVREIFQKFLHGTSASKIAKNLNRYHVATKRGGQWRSNTVINILRNSNYTGDMLCQKTYRDDQYHRHFNQGELTHYLIEDHHPSLINHETFNKVQDLLKEAIKKRHIETGSHKYQQHYLFSGKISCGNCGTTFKRQTRPNKICWACQRHLSSASQCPIKAVPEASLEVAFCNMMNKLIYSRKFLLQPLLENLQAQINFDTHGRLNALTERIKANDHKAETLAELMQSGLLDKAIYVNQTAQLEQDTYQCCKKIKQINSTNTDSANNFEDVKVLLRWCQKDQQLAQFDDELFQEFVQQIVVNKPSEVIFKLKCGLALTEKLTKATTIENHFYRGIIRQRFNEPIKQAQYLYSIIKSEGDLIG
ncbi:recombinase family protein [Lactobacillus gasseri]|uniref:recombinase family protein n=1 Tax=Lactobacillus gasseri TaxID=1596 RepID=UPI0002770256|nr:recombinase family protein [Lactobacillus gasseri]EJN54180.1 Site-specific recombinase, DNA invertase Pin related protein [Lactobacillus gasseri CECT 5714]MBV6740528.1 recombinase family protein [Lactobacillus gasseri CECT 5714]WEA88087.1 recombinase family protein [Lactobacillus gasseri]